MESLDGIDRMLMSGTRATLVLADGAKLTEAEVKKAIEGAGLKFESFEEHEVERILWPQLRGAVLREATEIFLRLLSGETIGSADIPQKRVRASEVDPETWAQACAAAHVPTSTTAFEFDLDVLTHVLVEDCRQRHELRHETPVDADKDIARRELAGGG